MLPDFSLNPGSRLIGTYVVVIWAQTSPWLWRAEHVEGVLKGPIVKPLNWSGGWGRVSRRRSLFGPFLVLLRTRSILILLCENTRVFFVDVNISLLPPNSVCRVFCSIFAKRKRGTWPFSFR